MHPAWIITTIASPSQSLFPFIVPVYHSSRRASQGGGLFCSISLRNFFRISNIASHHASPSPNLQDANSSPCIRLASSKIVDSLASPRTRIPPLRLLAITSQNPATVFVVHCPPA
ncbi:hypothetical protein BCV70DRAFT_73396 [Testicularia cyperi]|uniref:Uncharacterized protein n=1 Tax=Testicularia cyperi TaxID=1882483 RepID=A0A317XSY3_9BASI|nr:hypothetical protein BCV70DRAFT_73396 [Testicularia cyperi]